MALRNCPSIDTESKVILTISEILTQWQVMLSPMQVSNTGPSKSNTGVSREQELQSVRTDKQVVMLENQQLQIKARGAELTTDLGNELRVHHAFIRRGIALDMANIASYHVHEKVMREFMSHLTRTAPHGFKGPTIESVLRADRELWTRVADKVRSNLEARHK